MNATEPIPVTQSLVYQLSLSYWVAMENVKDVTHDQSLTAPDAGGNCMNWILGHIVSSRSGLVTMFGAEPLLSDGEAAVYKRGAGRLTDAKNAVPFPRLVAALESSQSTIVEGIKALDDERLKEKAPYSPINKPDETVESLISGLVFHDAYHIGQTGVLRAVLGKKGAA